MKRFALILALLLMATTSQAGDSTNNSYFYLPSIGASGASERTTWFNTLQNTDGVIDGLRDAPYWTNGTDSTLTAETDLESADLTVTGDWNFNTLAIGTSSVATSVLLDLSSSSAALRVTRLSDPGVSITSPLNGMIVYDSGDDQIQAYANGDWVNLGAAGGGGGGGSTVTVQIDDVTQMSGTITIDCQQGNGLTCTESPTDELNISISDSFLVNTGDTGSGDYTFLGTVTGTFAANSASTGATASADDSDTSLATTAFVQQEINGAGGTGLTCSGGQCNVDLGTAIDISSETNLVAGTNITLTGDTLSVDDSFLVNDANDLTSGSLDIGGTLAVRGLDCTGNANGGALTATATGDIVCSDDDNSGGGGSSVVFEIDGSSQSTATGTLDFDGTHFSITESPADDFDIAIADIYVKNTGDTISGTLTTTNLTVVTSFTATGLVGDEDLQSEDFGDFTCAGEDACTLDADTVSTSEIATGGVATAEILDDTVGLVDVAHTITLAGDPALAASQCFWGANGIICEGTTADAFEGLISFPVTTSDKTVTIQNQSQTLIGRNTTDTLTNKSISLGSNTVTSTSAQLRTALSDESGSGAAIFAGGAIGAATATTASADDNDTSVATTAFVQGEIDGAGGTNLSCSSGQCNVDDVFVLTAGDTMTGELTADEFGIQFTETDALTDCSTFPSTGGGIFYDDSEGKFKKCQDNTLTDLDTGGGGGGATNLTLPVYSMKITGTFVTRTPAGCSTTASAQGAQIDAGDANWKALFDASTDEAAVWQFVMPDNYSSSPTLDVHFSMASATANEVEWEAAIYCYTPGTDSTDITDNGFANCAVGTATTVASPAGRNYSQTITLTDDSCAAGDDVFIWLSTDADDATNDDATGDRELIGLEFGYTGS